MNTIETNKSKSRLGRNPFQPKAQVLKTDLKPKKKPATPQSQAKPNSLQDTETHWIEALALQAITFTIFAFVVAKTVFEKTLKDEA